MEHNAKIYVAGHAGMVGSAIVRKLLSEGYTNIITRTADQLDLRRQQAVEDFFATERPDYVFLAAARVGGILANNTYRADFIYDNLMIATNVIHASWRSGVKKLLNLGSSCIYPKDAPQPLKEGYLLTGPLESTNEPYAIAKIAAIKLCRYYNEQYKTNFISVMPTNLYGPGDNFNLETAHVLPALIRKFHLAKLLQNNDFDEIIRDLKSCNIGFGLDQPMPVRPEHVGGTERIQKYSIKYTDQNSIKAALERIGVTATTVTVWGSGNVYREFLHVDDVANAVFFLMQHKDQFGEIINIGAGTDLSIKELAHLINKIIGFDGAIVFDEKNPDGTKRKLLDVHKIKSLGWNATISLEEGLTKNYRDYCFITEKKRKP